MERIGYMGVPGSFSEIAAEKLTEQEKIKGASLLPLVSAARIYDEFKKRSISLAVLGVKNSSVGTVDEFTEAFDGSDFEVLCECTLPIHHCLYKKGGIRTEALAEVASHQQALLQTARTRAALFPGLREIEIDDTALGAEWLSSGYLPDTTSVICSQRAGKLWDLELIAENIEDFEDNRTTFLLIRLRS